MNNVTVNESDVLVSVVPDEISVTISDAVGIPPGGTANQVLKKNSATDYDVSWASDVAGVPYTGATQDVNLGEFGLLTGNIEFDTSPTNAPTGAGSMVWNDTEGTADLMLKGASVNLPIGQKQVVRAVNGTGGNLTRAAYRAVKITGAQGQRLQVSLARADNDANSKDTIGLVAEDISNNQEGFIVTSGTIASINTTGSLQGETWADGDTLYLSGTTLGVITNVKPSAPTHTVILGFVVYAHQNNGKIYVKVDNGYELDELHNVNVSTAATGDYLRYNGTLWVDSTIQAADLPTGIDAAKIGTGVVSNTEFGYLDGVTSAIQTQLNGKQATLTNPVTGTGTTNYIAKFTGTSAVGNSLIFDNGTNVGIGNTNTTYTFDVSGSGRFTGTLYTRTGTNVAIEMASTSALRNLGTFYVDFASSVSGLYRIRGGTNLLDYLTIKDTGEVGIGTITPSYKLDISGTLRNTTDAYFATSSGSVGIGTTSPSAKLHVAGSVLLTNTNALQFFNSSNVARSVITFFSDNNVYYDAEDGAQIFRTLGNERARINSGGNVSIGNTNNTYKLDISGTLRNTTDAYFATNSGGVGVGTLNPSTGKLVIAVVTGSNALAISGSGTGSQVWQFVPTASQSLVLFRPGRRLFGVMNDSTFFVGGNLANDSGAGAGFYVDGTTDNIGFGQTTFGTSATKTLAVGTGVAPTTSPADAFQMYSADITAGNAAAHFRTEGGAIIKLYQQTTGVAAATFAANSGTAVNDASTFDGYTLNQIVKALRNNGLLA
jgi:hypothetical protein